MASLDVVTLSRLQFAVTALYHFLFVPLTLGLSWILFTMESVYVLTDRPVYKDMTQFWGKLFAINFAMGVTTGLTLEFQFGTNWAFYSRYVGDVFGTPLAVEGLIAFFLESSFVGLFLFGWQRLSKYQHLMATFLVAIGTSFSSLFILVANAWMNNPVGAHFNVTTMRMEVSSVADIFLNPLAQLKFFHTIESGYVTAACFVLGISSWYLLKKRDIGFALRSFVIAAIFGLCCALSVAIIGDENGYELGRIEKMKIALIEGEWHTEKAPAAFNLLAWPRQDKQRNDYAVQIPWAMGLLVTRSANTPVAGIMDLHKEMVERAQNGQKAYALLEKLHAWKEKTGLINPEMLREFQKSQDDLGFALLVKPFVPDVLHATPVQISEAVLRSLPYVWPIFFSFRFMVFFGVSFIILFSLALLFYYRGLLLQRPWFLRWAVWWIPTPWLACELGWIIAEYGRQPWTISDILPTHLSASSLAPRQVMVSLAVFAIFYTVLFIVEMYLILKYARLGPSVLGTGRYTFEQRLPATAPA